MVCAATVRKKMPRNKTAPNRASLRGCTNLISTLRTILLVVNRAT
jgi:hypothetical protein